MKFIPLVLVLATVSFPILADEERGYGDAIGSAASYSGTIVKDNVGGAVVKPTKSFLQTIWGYVSDAGNGLEKQKALMSGDGVAINASVYSLALRDAERKNEPLKKMKQLQEESKRLEGLARDYQKDASNFGNNIGATLQDIAQTAKKLEGWDQKKQEKLAALLAEHKKLGEKTASDGDPRIASQTIVSLSETFAELETAIMKSPDKAQSIGLGGRLGAMKSLLAGASARLSEKESQIMAATKTLNDLERENGATPEEMQRKMVLGTLNNAVNNLITQAEFSKNRAQLAFSHFSEIEKELAEKGVKAGDVKKFYRDDKNLKALTDSYNDTPMGVYVNSQISKAMGSVCELVNNQCKDGTNSDLFKFLDDSSRQIYKDKVSVPADGSAGTVAQPK